MTRFLPLTRGGWKYEILCDDVTGKYPLVVKHHRPSGEVLAVNHARDGRAFLSEESKFDLIPVPTTCIAPEPSEAAFRAAMEAWASASMRSIWARSSPENAMKAGLRSAYAIDGITPQQQPDRVAELEAEVAKLKAERDEARHDEVDRFIELDSAGEEVERLTKVQQDFIDIAEKARRLLALFPANLRKEGTAFLAPDTQPGTGEQA